MVLVAPALYFLTGAFSNIQDVSSAERHKRVILLGQHCKLRRNSSLLLSPSCLPPTARPLIRTSPIDAMNSNFVLVKRKVCVCLLRKITNKAKKTFFQGHIYCCTSASLLLARLKPVTERFKANSVIASH
jgi:hypothetical protein